jgi:redox-sensitive bicupin YhaK (pirin superfamily)
MNEANAILHRAGKQHWVGNGFPAYSVFGYSDLGQRLSPFLLLDYVAPFDFAPSQEKRGVGAHPHRGFETVTIAYQGELDHRDSQGGGGRIGPGDVQWMTAARGIIHEEFHSPEFAKRGGTLQMVQLWVNLPARFKNDPPRYQTIQSKNIPEVDLSGAEGTMRIIAGDFEGKVGPARTYTRVLLCDVFFKAESNYTFQFSPNDTRLIFVIEGTINTNSMTANRADLVEYENGGELLRIHSAKDSRLLLMVGEPLNEPVVGYGPFVMNSDEEIEQAFRDYKAGAMGTLE